MSEKALQQVDESSLKKELGLDPPEEQQQVDPALEKLADEFLEKLMDPETAGNVKRQAVDEMGLKTQQDVTQLSKMLDDPIKSLAKTGGNGGPVAHSLLDLKEQVEELDPTNYDLTSAPGFFESITENLPFIGNKLSRYFAMYMSSEAVMDRIIKSLEKGKDMLNRDNITLAQDKERMLNAMKRLMRSIELGKILDGKIQYKLDRDISPDDDQHRFIKDELLFPLRQRIMDLQQTLNVTQQGILTIELIIRNNRELIRGVNRALNVTVSALQIAVATALALNNQEVVLDKIDALNNTTSKLIRHNAERLKTQGVEIHKKASESMLNIEDLEQSFADIKASIDDISKFRQEALPKMANSILRMDTLNQEAFTAVERMEKGDKVQSQINIDVDERDISL